MTFHLGWTILWYNQAYLEVWATVFQDEVHQYSLHPQSRDAKTKFCCCIPFK
ncbi:BAH_G0051760.mRNA.1.CDS.1 [Saccharomyces cerevisiae]|nr:SX2_G0035890.mRNA.1.CDS.1 [Saccharomyces cerevisiae]CAI4779443.1 BAH_G0051760.mRNA.1.CDS.1 [Saccharomyces cerevisiae]CAI4781010.1 BAG_1a_G0051750.mRNA.1.CDS.1 [Saccharomyces cerevisiae]CAI7337296.1 BAG_1a_G0051750.mRNA.1.CDS.1 [Saccharomyces cerevisiae]CAI7339009.1 BAH_G0051760.mRNA.1.CDS.1 [Saccharomyces cerevisiae]